MPECWLKWVIVYMPILLDAIEENLKRNLYMQSVYTEKMQKLRKGTIRIKTINGNDYYYLVYRDGNKVRTDYLGVKDQVDLQQINQELADHSSYKKQIRLLKKEEKDIRKAIRALGGS